MKILNAAGRLEVQRAMEKGRARVGIMVSDDAQLWGQLEKLAAGDAGSHAHAFAETIGALAEASGYRPDEVVVAVIPQPFRRDLKRPISGLLGLMDHGSEDPRYDRLRESVAEYLDARYHRDGTSRLN